MFPFVFLIDWLDDVAGVLKYAATATIAGSEHATVRFFQSDGLNGLNDLEFTIHVPRVVATEADTAAINPSTHTLMRPP